MKEILQNKYIFSDLDGTITDNSNKISKRTKNVIKKLANNSNEVVLCSGRAIQGMVEMANELGISTVISCNGAIVYDVLTNEIIFSNEIIEYKELLQYLKDNDYPFIVYGENYSVASSTDIRKFAYKNLNIREALSVIDISIEEFLCHNKLLKLIVIEENVRNSKILELFKDKLEFCFIQNVALEITALGVSKWTGILEYLKIKNLDKSDTICIGDETNDIEMIKESNIGIAMGDGVEDLKKVADFVTETFENDGFAHYFERFV